MNKLKNIFFGLGVVALLITACGKQPSVGTNATMSAPQQISVTAPLSVSSCGAISNEACAAFQSINAIRTQAGLPALTFCKRCSSMALEQAMDMVQRSYLNSNRSAADDRPAESLTDRSNRFQVNGASELLSQVTPASAVTNWQNASSDHAVIVNSSFVSVGIANFGNSTVAVFSTAADNSDQMPQILLSKDSSYSTFDWSFNYDSDHLNAKFAGVLSSALGCMEAYIPSRSQNDSHCRTNQNWASNPMSNLSQNPDWAPFHSADSSFVFGSSNPALQILKNHPIFPNAFGRYKLYLKNRASDPATIVMFEIQPGAPPANNTGPINTSNKAEVIHAYHSVYSSPIPDMGWTGDVANCRAGTTSLAYQQRVIDHINYYRNLAGLGSVTLTPNPAGNQEAALMMSANGQLNHSPPGTWKCYTTSGAGGAGSSNLALGTEGTGAIDIYMDDFGSNNYPVGHRRWLQNPNTGTFATGDVPGANSLAVWLGGSGAGMPARGFISWPSSGYFPMQNLPGSGRWSFSLPSGGFSTSTQISMRNVTDGVNYSSNIQPLYDGFGLPTIVWEPQNFSVDASGRDVTIRITISGLSSTPSSYTYDVILFNAQ